MAKNTLQFSEYKPSCSIVTAQDVLTTLKTPLYFDTHENRVFAMSDGDKMKNLGTVDIVLVEMTYNSTTNEKEYIVLGALDSGDTYEFSFDDDETHNILLGVELPDTETVQMHIEVYKYNEYSVNDELTTEGGNEYRYDNRVIISLNEGDKVIAGEVLADSGNMVLIDSEGDHENTVELNLSNSYTYTATDDEIWLAGAAITYSNHKQAYYIVTEVYVLAHLETRIGNKSLYTEPHASVGMKEGDTLKNMTSGSTTMYVLDARNGELLSVLASNGTYTANSDISVLICSLSTGVTLTYSIELVNPLYEAEYEGESGILQLRHAMGARVKVYGDAGAGYMLIHEMEGKEIVRCVNMSGFNSIKLVSDGEVDECIINEF